MRRNEREINNKHEIESILQKEIVCRIGVSNENMPYVFPVNYAYCEGCLYFHSASEGMKMDIIKINPNVCFELDVVHELLKTDESCNWGIKYESIIGFGKANFVEAFEEKVKALDLIMRHYDKDNNGKELSYEYKEDMVKKVVVVKIVVESMTGKRA